MQTGSLRSWTGILVLILLFAPSVRAQETPGSAGFEFAPTVPKPPPPAPAPPLIDGKLPVAEPIGPIPDSPPITHTVDGVPVDAPHFGNERTTACTSLEFWGEYLFLKARRDALDFALQSNNRVDMIGGTVQSLDWEAQSGFRGGAGWRLPGTEWELGLVYTYFHSADQRTLTVPSGGALFATLPSTGIQSVDSASADGNINFQVIDLDLRRRINLLDDFDLNVFGGGRFAWIDEKFNVLYNGGSVSNYLISSPVNFRGGGFSIGGDGFWNIWHGAGFYARARGSLLSGTFRSSLNETSGAGSVAPLPVIGVRDQSYDFVPVTEIGLGIAYRSDHLTLSVGYEMSNWYNMVNMPDFSSPTGTMNRRQGDLMLEGLAVQLGIMY
jgi:hypothetical protein